MLSMEAANSAQVVLIGGSSGTGKTILARRLSQRFGFPALQVDDFRLVLQRVVEAALEKNQAVHSLWDQLDLEGIRDVQQYDADSRSSAESLVNALIATAEAMSRLLEIVIAHHVSTQTPIIIEGDGLLPSLLTRRPIANLDPTPGQVQGIFLVEEEEGRLMKAALQRDRGFAKTDLMVQQKTIRASWLFGQWLKAEANKHAVPVLPPLPYESLVERALQVVQPGDMAEKGT